MLCKTNCMINNLSKIIDLIDKGQSNVNKLQSIKLCLNNIQEH